MTIENRKKRALLSVSDKRELVPFGAGLHALGWELLASGGTAGMLREHGIPVIDVADHTGSPEILGGRVKTLHPAVHGGILARGTVTDRKQLQQFNWDYIDLVAVNLYPFAETIARDGFTLEDAIENIDIGGVALIRAAAKNYQRVTVLTDPLDYAGVLNTLQSGATVAETKRKQLALKGFVMTAEYDTTIASFFGGEQSVLLQANRQAVLRYGENPHQSSELYNWPSVNGPLGGTVLKGKALSHNNILDLDAAWRTAISFEDPTVVIVKHLSPCGVASGATLAEAYPHALASDPVSAFGGIIAVNKPFDAAIAKQLEDLFVECIAAPSFTSEALDLLANRKNLRLLEMPMDVANTGVEIRSVVGGFLKQDLDVGDPNNADWTVVTERQPTDDEMQALKFAWTSCQHVKSNAIVFAKGTATVGIGSGQPNRVDCVHIAAKRAGENAKDSVMASDAFFPFPDCIEAAHAYGITAVVQPGGSKRDQLSIDKANALGIAMVHTGVRHFRH